MNNKILQKGYDLLKTLPDQKYKLVAIVTDKRDRILSYGCNSYTKSHPQQAYYAEKIGNKFSIFLHAEISALIKCKRKPYSIYIIRVNDKNQPVLAKPCEICMMAIKDMGIENIHYT